MRLEAVNNTIVIVKDPGDRVEYTREYMSQVMSQIPAPYTGVIKSIGIPNEEYNIGERVAFADIGGVYIEADDVEYVVVTPDMIIGKI